MDVTTLRDGVRERLGEILVRKGRLSPDQLDEAIIAAKASGDRLGTHLVNVKALHEEDLSIALADQFGLRYVVVDLDALTPELAVSVPERTARRLSVLPLAAAGGGVRLAIADPSDVVLIDELRMVVKGTFDLVLAGPTSIRAGLDRVYPPHTGTSHVEEPEETVEDDSQQSTIDAEGDADSAPAVEEVNRLLRTAIELGASDIHFVPRKSDLHVRARVDGVMRDVSVVPRSLRASVIARLKVMGQLDIAERRLPQDGRVSISIAGVDMDLRVALLPSTIGEEAVLRIAYIGKQGLQTLEDLGLDGRTLVEHASLPPPPRRSDHRRRPDRQREDDDPLRGSRRAQRRVADDRQHRGSRRVAGRRRCPDRGQPACRAHLCTRIAKHSQSRSRRDHDRRDP